MSIYDISLIQDILDVSKVFGLNTALISIAQEKAFDRVELNKLSWENSLYVWFQFTTNKNEALNGIAAKCA